MINALDILDKGNYDPRQEGLSNDEAAPVPEGNAYGQGTEDFHDRKKHGVIADAAQKDVPVVRVDCLEPFVNLLLLPERLDRPDSGNALLKVGIKSGNDPSAFPINVTGPAAGGGG